MTTNSEPGPQVSQQKGRMIIWGAKGVDPGLSMALRWWATGCRESHSHQTSKYPARALSSTQAHAQNGTPGHCPQSAQMRTALGQDQQGSTDGPERHL